MKIKRQGESAPLFNDLANWEHLLIERQWDTRESKENRRGKPDQLHHPEDPVSPGRSSRATVHQPYAPNEKQDG